MTRKERGFYIGTIVKHFKGRTYRIVDFAKHTENGEMLVLYRQMFPPYYLLARPEENFCSKIDKEIYPDIEQEYRFERVPSIFPKVEKPQE